MKHDLSGPQLTALFYMRDRLENGGAYAGNIRRTTKIVTLDVLYRLGFVACDSYPITEGTFVVITHRGREAIKDRSRPARCP